VREREQEDSYQPTEDYPLTIRTRKGLKWIRSHSCLSWQPNKVRKTKGLETLLRANG